jgi:hypothetical protein
MRTMEVVNETRKRGWIGCASGVETEPLTAVLIAGRRVRDKEHDKRDATDSDDDNDEKAGFTSGLARKG